MEEIQQNTPEKILDEEMLNKLNDILASLEDSQAVKAARLISEKGTTLTPDVIGVINGHPDLQLYNAIRKIIDKEWDGF